MQPSTLRGLTAATVALLVGLAPATRAQDSELPEEAAARVAARAAVERARAGYEEAQRVIEVYGRGLPVEPVIVTPAGARATALDRLLHPARRTEEAPARRPPFDVDSARDEMRQFRAALRARLRQLAPDRYPVARAPDDEEPEEPAEEPPLVMRLVDVQDLVIAPEDHFAPRTGLGYSAAAQPGAAGGASLSFDESDDSSSTPTVGIDADMLVELAEAAVGDDGPGGGSIEYSAGRLITRLRPAQQRRVTALLADLRRDRGGLVDLEVRVYRVTAAVFVQVRAEAHALGDAAEAILKAGDGATLLASHHVLAHDGQRVHVWRGKSRSYVADIEVNQTGVVPVLNPEVAVINEGLVVEARPIVDRVRGMVLLDVALSLTRVTDPIEVADIEDLQVELPLMQLSRTTSTGAVPLGRGALLGGTLDTGAEADDAVTCLVYVRPRLIEGKQVGKEGGR